MIVNTTSWHYRFNVWKTTSNRTRAKNSLCSYFWFTMWNIFWLVFWPVVGVTVFYWLGYGVIDDSKPAWLSWWVNNQDGLWQRLSYPFLGVVFIAGIIVLVVAFFATLTGAKKCIIYTVDVIKHREPRKPKDKEPNLFWEYLKAKKAKVCPIIKFEGDENV